MDNERIIVKLRQYKKLLAQQMQVQQLILFGSWARGSARAESDIDVAVVVDGIKGDFFLPGRCCGRYAVKWTTVLSRFSWIKAGMTAAF